MLEERTRKKHRKIVNICNRCTNINNNNHKFQMFCMCVRNSTFIWMRKRDVQQYNQNNHKTTRWSGCYLMLFYRFIYVDDFRCFSLASQFGCERPNRRHFKQNQYIKKKPARSRSSQGQREKDKFKTTVTQHSVTTLFQYNAMHAREVQKKCTHQVRREGKGKNKKNEAKRENQKMQKIR